MPSPRISTLSLHDALPILVASGQVAIVQPGRRANGDLLVYTTSDDKFVLTGGSPSIFDAEQGKITGVSLTLFRHDGRVVVEGKDRKSTRLNSSHRCISYAVSADLHPFPTRRSSDLGRQRASCDRPTGSAGERRSAGLHHVRRQVCTHGRIA